MAEQIIFVSPDGDDEAAGSPQAPLCSVQRAMEGALPGRIVQLAAGEYPPVCLEEVRGTKDEPIILRGAGPMPVDFSPAAELDRNLYVLPLRQALEDGGLALKATNGLTVLDGRGCDAGLLVQGCTHLRIENRVVRDARTNLLVRRSQHVTVRDCVVCGEPAVSRAGVVFQRANMDERPSRSVRLERVLAYGLKEIGFGVQPGAVFESDWVCCIAHSMQSSGGDGFSFSHVTPTDRPGRHPCRVFADGIGYRIRLTRCAALRNRLDGFDVGNGVDGVTLEYCLGDGNGWGAYHAKDLKVWSPGNTFRFCRMTGRVLFGQGTQELEDFKTGVKEDGP